jgi:hypothetical protein
VFLFLSFWRLLCLNLPLTPHWERPRPVMAKPRWHMIIQGLGGSWILNYDPPSTHKKVVLSPVFVYVYHLLGSFIFEGWTYGLGIHISATYEPPMTAPGPILMVPFGSASNQWKEPHVPFILSVALDIKKYIMAHLNNQKAALIASFPIVSSCFIIVLSSQNYQSSTNWCQM